MELNVNYNNNQTLTLSNNIFSPRQITNFLRQLIWKMESTQKPAKLLIIPHCKLNVPWHYAILLVIPCCIPSQLQYLYSIITIIKSQAQKPKHKTPHFYASSSIYLHRWQKYNPVPYAYNIKIIKWNKSPNITLTFECKNVTHSTKNN